MESELITGIIITLSSLATVFGIVYMIITARNRERMALIERGADPSLFETVKKSPHRILKWGMFLFGIGLGIVFGNILASNDIMNNGAAYFSMILVFGGIALIAFHLFINKQSKEQGLGI